MGKKWHRCKDLEGIIRTERLAGDHYRRNCYRRGHPPVLGHVQMKKKRPVVKRKKKKKKKTTKKK